VRHDIRDEELACLDVVLVIADDQQLDAGILVLPDQIDASDTVTKPRNGPRPANRSRFAAAAASSRASSQPWVSGPDRIRMADGVSASIKR
jgi:hypothetical protein